VWIGSAPSASDVLHMSNAHDCFLLALLQIKALGAMGGGDEPEDIMAALSAAAGLDWQAKARFLALIGDAPAHGRDCNNVADNYPGGSPAAGCDVPTVMQRLRDLKVDVMVMPGALLMWPWAPVKPTSTRASRAVDLMPVTGCLSGCFSAEPRVQASTQCLGLHPGIIPVQMWLTYPGLRLTGSLGICSLEVFPFTTSVDF